MERYGNDIFDVVIYEDRNTLVLEEQVTFQLENSNMSISQSMSKRDFKSMLKAMMRFDETIS